MSTDNLTKRSASQEVIETRRRLTYAFQLTSLWIKRFFGATDHVSVIGSIAAAAYDYERLTGDDFRGTSVLEIGFGARPLRMRALHSMGVDAVGIDLDVPLLSLRDALAVSRSNGPLRAAKSVGRHLLFDRREYRLFDRLLRAAGLKPALDSARLLQGDVIAFTFPDNWCDVILSFDVFEHLPFESMETLVENMHRWLRPGGIAIIQPMVYTGLAGDHWPETYPHRVLALKVPVDKVPWTHLDSKTSSPADTYLNHLTRRNYRDAFSRRFAIIDERPVVPGLGYFYLNKAPVPVRATYPIEELLSNGVRFILQKRDK